MCFPYWVYTPLSMPELPVVGFLELRPHPHYCAFVGIFVMSVFGWPCGFTGDTSNTPKEHSLTANSWACLALTVFLPPLQQCSSSMQDFVHALGLGSTALHLDWLGFSVVVSTWYMENVLDESVHWLTDTTLEKLDFPYNTISSFHFFSPLYFHILVNSYLLELSNF